MSQQPEPISCAQAVEHLYEYLDREITPEVEAQVRHHLEQCIRCAGRFDFEDQFLNFLEARARTRTAPPDLRQRIIETLRIIDAESSGNS